MATSIITGTVLSPNGTALENVRVVVRLLPRPAFKTSTGAELSTLASTTTNSSGVYSFTLERTADITPSNSYYEIIEYIKETLGGVVKHVIQVGSSNATVLASLVSSPPAPGNAVYLTQAAADARYVASPGSFASSVTDSRPNDAATSGVASTYSRGDHTHDRETLYGTAAARAALTGNDLYEGVRFHETDTDKFYEYVNAAWHEVISGWIATAANKPAATSAGQRIYVTDATNITGTGIYTPDTTSQPARVGNEWVHNGTRWQYGEWGKPWGIVGYAEITSSFGFTTLADVTGLSITATYAANRRIRLTAYTIRMTNLNNDDASTWFYIREGSTTLVRSLISHRLQNASGGGNFAIASRILSPTAGSHTYKVSAERITAVGNCEVTAAADSPAYLLIEDLGPNGAPA